MVDWTEGDVSGEKGLSFHYYRTGGEKPPAVLLHGITDSGRCWTPMVEALSGRYDVITLDAYGHGLSSRVDESLPKQRSRDHLYEFIAALDVQKPVLMGHSMGAGTVADFASNYPDIPRAIVLEDPAWRDPRPDLSPKEIAAAKRRSQMFSRWTGILKQKSRDDLISHCRKNNPTWPEVELYPWAESKLQFDMSYYGAMHAATETYPEIVEKIRCPALLISGEPALGGIITTEVAEKIGRIWKDSDGSRWVRIAGAGHNIRREQFQAYRDEVWAFLTALG